MTGRILERTRIIDSGSPYATAVGRSSSWRSQARAGSHDIEPGDTELQIQHQETRT